MREFDSEVDAFIRQGMEEVAAAMTEAGEAAVSYNIENGDYRNRTGRLRASNFYAVSQEGLTVGNSAPYAADVEARGYMVCSGGALLAEMMLNGD